MDSGKPEYKILTWNMQGGGTSDSEGESGWDSVLNYMDDQDIEIACLQECSKIGKDTMYESSPLEGHPVSTGFISHDSNTGETSGIKHYYYAHYSFSKKGDTAGRCSFATLIRVKEEEVGDSLANKLKPSLVVPATKLRPVLCIPYNGYQVLNLHAPSTNDNFVKKVLLDYLKSIVNELNQKFVMGGDFNIDREDLCADEDVNTFFVTNEIKVDGSKVPTHQKCLDEEDLLSDDAKKAGGLDEDKSKEYDYFIFKGIEMDPPKQAELKSDHIAVESSFS